MAVTRFYYDAAGNIVHQDILCNEADYSSGDEVWRVIKYTYGNRGRVIDTILYDDVADQEIGTRFAYDGVGNKLSQLVALWTAIPPGRRK